MQIVLLLVAALGLAAPQSVPAGSPEYFETKVRPILANNCYACHTTSALSGLRLDSLDAMKKGGKRGAAIVVGDPENSLLIQALRHSAADGLKMPMGGKLKDADIEVLTTWIKAGAVWPKDDIAVSGSDNKGGDVIPPERKNFWSFQPLRNPSLPEVKDKTWPKTAIDRFVLGRLEQEGL